MSGGRGREQVEIELVDDPPGVGRDAVADQRRGAIQRAERLVERAAPRLVHEGREDLAFQRRQSTPRDRWASSATGRASSASICTRTFNSGRLEGSNSLVMRMTTRAQVPHEAVGPLDVPAQPVQVVGHAAGQVVAAAAEFHGRGLRTQERNRGDRPVGKDPHVLARGNRPHGRQSGQTAPRRAG